MKIGGRPSAPHAMEEKKGASKTRSVPPPTQDRTRNAAENFLTLKIEGKGVPPRSRGEHLLHLVQQIARKDLGLKIWASDVAKVERQTPNRKSPILVK